MKQSWFAPQNAASISDCVYPSLHAFTGFLCVLFAVSPASALEPTSKEADQLAACEEKLCRQILDKAPLKGMFRCDLGKTWQSADINEGAETKSMSWGFGDAQCAVQLKVKRQDILKALTAPKHEFSVRPHNVDCTVETEEGNKPLKAQLAPKMIFEDGKAKKVWIRLKEIDGPEPLSSFVWSTAKLEDSIGIFHSEMIKQINKFVYHKCERRYGEKALARKARKARREVAKKRRAEAIKRRAERADRIAKRKARQERLSNPKKKNTGGQASQ